MQNLQKNTSCEVFQTILQLLYNQELYQVSQSRKLPALKWRPQIPTQMFNFWCSSSELKSSEDLLELCPKPIVRARVIWVVMWRSLQALVAHSRIALLRFWNKASTEELPEACRHFWCLSSWSSPLSDHKRNCTLHKRNTSPVYTSFSS